LQVEVKVSFLGGETRKKEKGHSGSEQSTGQHKKSPEGDLTIAKRSFPTLTDRRVSDSVPVIKVSNTFRRFV